MWVEFSLRTVVFISPEKSSFLFSNSVRVEKKNWHGDFWIKPSFSQFIRLFVCSSSPFFVYLFVNLFIHVAKQHPLLV